MPALSVSGVSVVCCLFYCFSSSRKRGEAIGCNCKPYYVRSADENVGGFIGCLICFVSGSRYFLVDIFFLLCVM